MRFHNFGCISFVSSEFLKQVQKSPKSWEKVQLRSSIRIRKKHSYRLEKPLKLPFFFAPLFQTIMDKSLGTLLPFWGVSQFTQDQPLPSPHKQCWTRVSKIFSEFQLFIRWGRENCKKISKRMHCFKREPINDRKILQYCPKDFCSGL